MLRKQPAKLQSLRNFCMKIYFREGLSPHYSETLCIKRRNVATFCHKVSLSQTQFIGHSFCFRQFNFINKDAGIQL